MSYIMWKQFKNKTEWEELQFHIINLHAFLLK